MPRQRPRETWFATPRSGETWFEVVWLRRVPLLPRSLAPQVYQEVRFPWLLMCDGAAGLLDNARLTATSPMTARTMATSGRAVTTRTPTMSRGDLVQVEIRTISPFRGDLVRTIKMTKDPCNMVKCMRIAMIICSRTGNFCQVASVVFRLEGSASATPS